VNEWAYGGVGHSSDLLPAADIERRCLNTHIPVSSAALHIHICMH
jgi:hypothetical protein